MILEYVNTPTRSALAWRGLANVLLGLVILVWPQVTVYIVILFFALNIILVGLFSILEPLFDNANQHAFLTVVLGILSVAFGVYLIIKPEFAASIAGLLIGFWALLFGVHDLLVSYEAIKVKFKFAWVLVMTGIVSVIFGIYMLLSPLQGILNIIWIIGLYAVVIGSMLLLSSLFVKSSKTKVRTKNA